MKVLKIVALVALGIMVASAAFAGSTYDRVMKTKTVRVGTQTSSAPAGFINENGDLVGFDVDIAKEICKRVGAQFKHTEVNNTTRITMLVSGQLDMTLANRMISAM